MRETTDRLWDRLDFLDTQLTSAYRAKNFAIDAGDLQQLEWANHDIDALRSEMEEIRATLRERRREEK